ncbi:MAG: diaminopimelate decarboxylase [Chloroflexota bacterium]|nr:MAG: diaminopimelate decarboxylase [Chloroflexota bacterium]
MATLETLHDLQLIAAGAFGYRSGELSCESVPLSEIASEFCTPTYVYTQSGLVDTLQAFRAAAQRIDGKCLTCFAVKANGSPALLAIMAEQGIGADVVSGGELYLAEAAGIDPQRIVFSGVGKTKAEIEEAISAGILALHVESPAEMELVAKTARALKRRAPVAVRVNPDVHVSTHAGVATGEKGHKFGVEARVAQDMMRAAADSPWLRPIGLSAHIGSQIASIDPFRQSAEKLGQLADLLTEDGIRLRYVDAGGGLAIDYGAGSGPEIAEWLATVSEPIVGRGYDLLVEPGRSIIGPAGILLTRVLYMKEQSGRQIAVVDAGMNDLLRPALYGAQHPIVPVNQRDTAEGQAWTTYEIVGPVCESTDVLATDLSLSELRTGDLLAVLQAGAYGYVMSSNYNGRGRPAEVLVEKDRFHCIRQREHYDSLLLGCSLA